MLPVGMRHFEHTLRVDWPPSAPGLATLNSLPATQGAALAESMTWIQSKATRDSVNVRSCCYGGESGLSRMNFTLECEQEIDGRWIAEVPELPGVLSYGNSAADAMSRAEILALRVIADRLEHGESEPVSISLSLPVSA